MDSIKPYKQRVKSTDLSSRVTKMPSPSNNCLTTSNRHPRRDTNKDSFLGNYMASSTRQTTDSQKTNEEHLSQSAYISNR